MTAAALQIGMLDTVRVLASVYAVIAFFLALLLLFAAIVAALFDRDWWEGFCNDLEANGSNVGEVLALYALGWPWMLWKAIRHADRG